MHVVREYRAASLALACPGDQLLKTVAVKDVVANDQRRWITTEKVGTNDECLRQAVRAVLHRIADIESPA